MSNSLYNSKVWINYLEEHFDECTYYFKFAMVWISFNAYYSSKYTERWERDRVSHFANDNISIYNNLLRNGFINIIREFKDTGWLYGQSGERDRVKDMKPGSEDEYFLDEEHQSCEDFFQVLYQIRCNFFHGDKDVSDEGNKELVMWAYKYLSIFWNAFLDSN